MAYKRRTYRKKKTTYRKRAGPIKRAIKKASKQMFARKVKNVVSRMAESKVVNYDALTRAVVSTASVDMDTSIKNLIPDDQLAGRTMITVGQDVDQGDRVGNKIRPVSAILRGCVRINTLYEQTTNYNPCPVRVTMWICKLQKTLQDDVTTFMGVVRNSFFQSGSVSVGFTGQLFDLTKSVNRDQIILVKRRSWLLGASEVVSAFAVNNANNATQRFMNNDASMSKMFKINLTKHYPKMIRFNDGTDIASNCRKMYLMFTAHRVDGNIPTSGPTGVPPNSVNGPVPAYVDLGFEMKYKDF